MKWLLPLVFILAACTSDDSKLEGQAIEEATKQFQTELKEELAKTVTGKEKIQFTAVDIITKKTGFEIAKKNITSSSAHFEIHANTLPSKVRVTLFEIMGRLDPAKEARFNVSDAIALTTKNLGLSSDERTSQIYKLNFKKEGTWRKVD